MSVAVMPGWRRPVSSTPTISGTARLKQVVTANAGSWAPTPTSFAYQWLRDGVAIPGATAATYAAVVDDVNHRLAVRVTGVRSGFTSVTRQSAATRAASAASTAARMRATA